MRLTTPPIFLIIRPGDLIVMDRRSHRGRAGYEIDVLYLAIGIASLAVEKYRRQTYGNPHVMPDPTPAPTSMRRLSSRMNVLQALAGGAAYLSLLRNNQGERL